MTSYMTCTIPSLAMLQATHLTHGACNGEVVGAMEQEMKGFTDGESLLPQQEIFRRSAVPATGWGFTDWDPAPTTVCSTEIRTGELWTSHKVINVVYTNTSVNVPSHPSPPASNVQGLPTLSDQTQCSTMSTQDLCAWAMVPRGKCRGGQRQPILNNITCVFKKGVNIILGPTGCGKTTLLDVMAGRKKSSTVSGQVLLDGMPRPRDFKTKVGYVTQEDVLMGILTVKESITFSAALRLPSSFDKLARRQRVNDVISELGLDKCADSRVGDGERRGISGGERKRCNIGMEMIISPPVLFLDEPTTGLDSSTANSVLKLLKRMARAGRVIILSIHQPRFSIYQLVDSTTILAYGRLLYQGPPTSAIDFFASQGFVCPSYNNPADFFLDTIVGTGEESSRDLAQTNAEKLIEGFKTSEWQAKIEQELATVARISGQVSSCLVQKFSDVMVFQSNRTSSWCRQFTVISSRNIKDVIKNPEILFAMVMKAFILASFVGSLFFQLDNTNRKALQDRTGVIFFLSLIQQFINLSAVNVFIVERRIFMHETSNGYYGASAYFLSRVVCDLIPLRLLPVAIVTVITHFAIGLRTGWEHIGMLFLGLYAVSVTSACIMFLVGCCVSKDEVGQVIGSMIVALNNLYAGFLINFNSIPKGLAWIQYLSVAKYGFQILTVNEFSDREFPVEGTNFTISGDDYLHELDIGGETKHDIVPDFIALGSISGLVLTLAYLRLRFTKLRH